MTDHEPLSIHRLLSLRTEEDSIRERSLSFIAEHPDIDLHFQVADITMNFGYTLHQYNSSDQDFRVIQIAGMRMFNALASSVRLILGGYYQNAAMILRDVLETGFLLDLFGHEPTLISHWRHGTKPSQFLPAAVRKKLDEIGGLTGREREKHYKALCERAAHFSMRSGQLMQSDDGNIRVGPFFGMDNLTLVSWELGRISGVAGLALTRIPMGSAAGINAAGEELLRVVVQWQNSNRSAPQERVE